MKLNTSYIKCLLLLAVVFSVACKKLVDIDEPIDTVTSVKIFNSDDQASQTLAGLYSQMVGTDGAPLLTFGGASIYGGLASDELVPSNPVDYSEENEFFTNSILIGNTQSENVLWTAAYKTIYAANAILDGEQASTSAQFTPGKRNELKASAKFIRAFGFFYLTNFYGEIPLPLSSKYSETIKLTRVSQQAVYEQIIKDLTEAIALFPQSTASSTVKSKANQLSAEALLARTYLYAKNWEQAALHANNVMNSGQFSLGTLANTFEKNSTETIFELNVNRSILTGRLNETVYLAPYLSLYLLPEADQEIFLDPSAYAEFQPYLVPLFYLNENLVNAFESGDQRKTTWVNYNGSPTDAPYNGKKYYFSNKYPNDEQERTSYIVIRLAEMYLIRAEALAMQNKTDLALADLNKIRNRAGLGNSLATDQSSILVAIAQERRSELFTEWGHRFFDLKRTGKAISELAKTPEKSAINTNKLLFPIPSKEIIANPRLTQNPGY
ncbi:RagB/SusD family nutrient uptake outer membrane protein [Pedobacter gandavensis]|uniref:RagB/SusD family nutrient uptake outer membrane protein n=1 Tax=Pedobacter gandavensis TaxID=2679963 RepID=A0ABR6EST9_9SPHI|nr:RagB/SusD family nutrient uptake outer membrane protein [Pedobacter gandavensis]MBB2148122.1 RagB/SusD family nutrient uptake outer membrane protein [Pedobacter gandavensis]